MANAERVVEMRQWEYDEMKTEIERLTRALREVEEWADNHADVDDGNPNDAMRMLVIVRAALQ